MPIYEFYCKKCHMIFNFFSSTVNTDKRPLCPRCRKVKLERQMSLFSRVRHPGEEEDAPMPDIDESKLENAMNLLGREAETLDENDPKQAANLMRKLSGMTGMNLGSGMEEALRRMEAGEDPEQIEQEMGDLLEGEDPFSFGDKKPGKSLKKRPPVKDETLMNVDGAKADDQPFSFSGSGFFSATSSIWPHVAILSPRITKAPRMPLMPRAHSSILFKSLGP
jgi:putative FmdB family regulatory protein